MAVAGADSTGAGGVQGDAAPGLAARFRAVLADIAEREGSRLTVWSPVLLVLGIWSYFALRAEPPLALSVALVLTVVLLLWRAGANPAVRAVCIVAGGFVLAQLRTLLVATPLLRAYVPEAEISGWVADVEQRSARHAVLVIDVDQATGFPNEEVPVSARIELFGTKDLPRIGDKVSGFARLFPLPSPASPGGFDYGRSLFFESIGAIGTFIKAPVPGNEPVPWRYQLRRSFHDLRRLIGERVRNAIDGPLGSFADALITGERAQIPRSMNDSLRASGLFHILSISGLHMAMVAGSAFWLVRAILAMSPRLALTKPIKSWAAGVALLIAFFYMMLADSGAATERSFVMVAIVLFAVMINRTAISLHNLAIAAVIILVFAPEQAISASFQMSFLAVMGLAAFFEWWNHRTQTEFKQRPGWTWRTMRWLVLLMAASLLTSLIAGGLSGIAAAHHFGRVAPYGIVANALALPVVSLMVMPFALAAVLLMPFGLDGLPLAIMGQGLSLVMWISDWIASWPHANLTLPLLPASVAAALALAAGFACIAQSALRWLAVPCLLAAGILWSQSSAADILVDERARTVAAGDADGFLVPLDTKGRYLPVSRWLREAGQDERPSVAAKRKLWVCEGSVCRAEVKGRSLVFLRQSAEITKPCPQADILVAQYPLRRSCRGRLVTIDRFDVWRQGAYAVTLGETANVRTARAGQGDRPWTWKPRPRRSP